jgi:hypothetical protein
MGLMPHSTAQGSGLVDCMGKSESGKLVTKPQQNPLFGLWKSRVVTATACLILRQIEYS